MGGEPALLKLTWAWTGAASGGRECVWGSGAVTSLQTLQTLDVFEVGVVTKALHGRYRALQARVQKGLVFGAAVSSLNRSYRAEAFVASTSDNW